MLRLQAIPSVLPADSGAGAHSVTAAVHAHSCSQLEEIKNLQCCRVQMVATLVVSITYKEVESVCCTTEANVTLCNNYSNKRLIKKNNKTNKQTKTPLPFFPGPFSLGSMFSTPSSLHVPPSATSMLPSLQWAQTLAEIRTNHLPETTFRTIRSPCLLIFSSSSNSRSSVFLKKRIF